MKIISKLALLLVAFSGTAKAQIVEDNRMVGIVAFGSGKYQDSLAAKDINATTSRVMVQTKRFTVLDIQEWKKAEEEIDRQKDAAFMERDIIAKGKSLGAKVLVIGFVKNAEIYQDGEKLSARVDYDLKFVDVETGKSIAASSFKGDSEGLTNATNKAATGLKKMIMPSFIAGKSSWKAMYLGSSALSAMSEAEKKAINGKLVDAIESTASPMNAWIRKTFNFSLFFLKVLDEDKKKGVEHLLIEGGEDVGLQQGDRLKLVLVTETETSRGKIRDEEPIADLEIEELRAQTSKCKVLNGGKKIEEHSQDKNLRVVYK